MSIADTGIGMTGETLAKLFQPFQQADGSMSRRFGGTGLGLAIVKRLIEAMGGYVKVESVLDHGSTFTMVVPGQALESSTLRTRESSAAAAPCPPRQFAGEVLLVEDNAVNMRLAVAFLRKLGIEAHSAVDGTLALARVESRSFDLILMDCQMPVMDGFEATRAIRKLGACATDSDPVRSRTPIVALTANAMPEDRQRCMQSGMDGYLSKPLDRSALANELAKWLPVTGGRSDGPLEQSA